MCGLYMSGPAGPIRILLDVLSTYQYCRIISTVLPYLPSRPVLKYDGPKLHTDSPHSFLSHYQFHMVNDRRLPF